jgi:hypothetical protein
MKEWVEGGITALHRSPGVLLITCSLLEELLAL